MQFHFPQYIDLEDKIFGPLTLKQAIYVAGGTGGAYVIYRLVPFWFLSVPLIVGIGALTWALAFFPREKLGKPFIEILEAAFSYALREKLYTWKKTTKEPKVGEEHEFVSSLPPPTPSVPSGTLSSASFGLDVRGPKVEEGKKLGKDADLEPIIKEEKPS